MSSKKIEKAVARFQREMDKAEKRIVQFLDDMRDSADTLNTCAEDMDAIQTCTRESPHVCKKNGPCNGWPRY